MVSAMLLSLMLPDSSVATEPPTVRRPGVQDLLFITQSRVMVIRLNIDSGEAPFETSWMEDLQERFRKMDIDGDGTLTESELTRLREQEKTEDSELRAILSREEIWCSDLSPVDRRLTFAEIVAFMQSVGRGALQSESLDLEAGNSQQRMKIDLGRNLFDSFDSDRNGQLTESELGAVRDAARSYDFDGDGALSSEELLHTRNPFAAVGINQEPQQLHAFRLLVLQPERPLTATLDAIFSLAGSSGRRRDGTIAVPLQRFFLPSETAARYDLDGSGSLDRNELRRFLLRPVPLVEMRVNRRPANEAAAGMRFLKVPPPGQGVEVRENELGIACLAVENLQLEFLGGKTSPPAEQRAEEITKRFFIQYDGDNNGYIGPKEILNLDAAGEARFFRSYDHDEDEKVFPEEVRTVVEEGLRSAAFFTRVTGQNFGQDLFTILDNNRDFRLSHREMLAIGERLPLWDLDADKQLSPAEVPQVYQVELSNGGNPFTLPEVYPVVSSPLAPNRAPVKTEDAPLWFQRMDRNRDGDVSTMEFLGTREQFDELDQNGDELLDPKEAGAARKRLARD